MKLNGDERGKVFKPLALKSATERSGGKVHRSTKFSKSEDASNEGVFDDNSNDEGVSFIIKRFQ